MVKIIIDIPIIKYKLVCLGYLYLRDSGNNCVSDIDIIIPAIRENNIPSIRLFRYGNINKYVIKAPNGSDKADSNV